VHTVEISDDLYHRLEEFTAVARSVMGTDVDTETCLAIALERGLQAMLATQSATKITPHLLNQFNSWQQDIRRPFMSTCQKCWHSAPTWMAQPMTNRVLGSRAEP
jgi:hypothetical protein